MYSFRLTATNINTAEDLNFIQFAVKRHQKNHKGGGGRKSKDGNKGSVREFNCTAKAGNKTTSKLNKKGIRKCHHPKHGAVS